MVFNNYHTRDNDEGIDNVWKKFKDHENVDTFVNLLIKMETYKKFKKMSSMWKLENWIWLKRTTLKLY